MEISKEAKIGITGFVILAAILFIFNYLNRQNVFSRNLIITVECDNLGFIRKGDIVLIKGREYGNIVAIYKEGDRLLLDLDIEPQTKIPKTTTAVISELSLMGGFAVSLVYEKTCESDCLETGDRIPGRVYTMKEQVTEGAKPILEKIGSLADTIAGANGMKKVMDNAYNAINRLNKTTEKTNRQLRGLNRSFPNNVKDFKQLTDLLLRAKKSTAQSLSKDLSTDPEMAAALGTFVNNMSKLDQAAIDSMTQMFYTAHSMAEKVPTQLETVKGGIAKANETLDKLDKSLVPYQEGSEGMVPKLLYDEDFKEDTRKSVEDVAKKVKDIREHPEKYLSTKK